MQSSFSISNALVRLGSALAIVWLGQFGIVLWFMIGQGYDRATADLIPIVGLAMLPIIAWLLRSGLPELKGPRSRRMGRAMLQAAILYAMGLIVPAQVILHGIPFSSPFDELWWMLGSATTVLAAMLIWRKGYLDGSARSARGVGFALLLLLGSALSLPGWRVFVFGFFG